jgi:hypothetical protein
MKFRPLRTARPTPSYGNQEIKDVSTPDQNEVLDG